jgi:2-polyprenyl-3-methyl-5-hydroxy-6-metoxy-1,4-benzoquinol methylase
VRRSERLSAQRKFYESRRPGHLQPRLRSFYADKLAGSVASATGMTNEHRVLEVGAGFGRFTFSLLDHCGSVVALDLSRQALGRLEEFRDQQSIPEARCRVCCCSVEQASAERTAGPFDFVVGFFLLHHLDDPAATIEKLASLLAPAGCMAFVEPNRWNPLFALQITFSRELSWRVERGVYRLGGRDIARAYRAAGLVEVASRSFGFFPPALLNRFGIARRIEERLEKLPVLGGIRPFLLATARTPANSGGPGRSQGGGAASA